MAVAVDLAGHSSDDVERSVVTPIEQALSSVTGARWLRSRAASGRGEIRIGFQDEAAARAALKEVRRAVVSSRPGLPPDADEPAVALLAAAPRTVLALRTDDSTSVMDASELAERVRQRLLAEPGVIAAAACAGVVPEVLVVADPARMAATGVEPVRVAEALEAANPAAEPSALGDLVVGQVGEAPIRLRDLAQVSLGARPSACAAREGGAPVVVLEVTGGSDLAAAAGRINPELPPRTTLTVLSVDAELAAPGQGLEAAVAASRRVADAAPDAAVIALAERDGRWSAGAWPPESVGAAVRVLVDLPAPAKPLVGDAAPGTPDPAPTARLDRAARGDGAALDGGSLGRLSYRIDASRAAELGIDPATAWRTARMATTGLLLGQPGAARRIRLALGEAAAGADAAAAPDLAAITVSSRDGKRVPLSSIVSLSTGPDRPVLRADRRRVE